LVLAHLFIKVPRPGDSEGIFSVFESSFFLLLVAKALKGRGNLVKSVAQEPNNRACRLIFTLSL